MNNSGFILSSTAYAGEAGKLRQDFCIDYFNQKKRSLQRIDDEITKQINSRGETVTCRKSCPECCAAYIEANIQECEAITFYLYEHPAILGSFLTRYNKWRSRMRQISRTFATCEVILHQDPQLNLSCDDQVVLLETLKKYHGQNIPCSFLEEGDCSIHEVRPYVCANHLVTTPETWCRAENWCDRNATNHPKIYMTAIDELYETRFYQSNLEKPVIGFMPAMVYRILTEGTGYIQQLIRHEKRDIS
jgi:Fe-S-cluster containining protein